MTQTVFPDDFLWGAATAAYQIEASGKTVCVISCPW